MIELNNIHVLYGQQVVFDHTSLLIPNGKLVSISGKSGSGKTTLFYMLGLISSFQNYTYHYNGRILDLSNDQEKAMFRKNRIGFLFQDKNLHEYLSIEENIQLYTYISGKDYSIEKAKELLKLVHLEKDLSEKCIHLSGGEKQRLAIACMLSKDPELIICDEPTSALDHENRDTIIALLKEIAATNKMVVIASHDQDVVKQCDLHYFIEDHKIKTQDVITPTSNNENGLFTSLFHSFNQWYTSFEFGISKKTSLLLSLLPILMITCFLFLKGIQQANILEYQNKLNNITSNEVLVTYKNQIPDSSIPYFNNMDEVKDVYAFNQEVFYHSDLDQVVKIVPYLDFQITDSMVDLIDSNGEVYISNNLYANQSTILIHDIEYRIKGVIKENTSLVQGEIKNTIYIPYQESQNESYSMVLLSIDSFESLEGLSEKIHQYNSNYSIVFAQGNYVQQIQLLTQYKNTFNQFMLITIIIMMILLSVVNFIAVDHQKYEIAILKANGLSKIEVLKMMGYLAYKKVSKASCIIIAFLLISYLVCKCISIPFELLTKEMIGVFVLTMMIVYLLPILIMTYLISSVNTEKLLRF